MANKQKPASNFDFLAKDLTKMERVDLLNKIRPEEIEIVIPTEETIESKAEAEKKQKEKNSTKAGLINQYKKESAIRRLVIWLKSIFTSASVEEIYNEAVVLNLAKQVEKQYPNLIDYRRKTLGYSFCTKINDLKTAQDFFKSHIANVEQDVGVFYFVLASTIMGDISNEIKRAVDPYQYPLNKPLASDTRNVLLGRMDQILNAIPSEIRSKMTDVAQYYEWLKAFVKLPLNTVASKFSAVEGSKNCYFSQVKTEYPQLAKYLSNPVSIPAETLRAIFLTSSTSKKGLWSFDQNYAVDDSVTKNSSDASTEVSVINMFINTVPVKSLGKIIFENSLYVPDSFYASEVWLQRYREEWRSLFDYKWRCWNCDFKKDAIKKNIKLFFGLTEFPKFPGHPWEKVREEAPFQYELSLGFLHHYMKKVFATYASILNVVNLEGDFTIKENRREFNDTLTDLSALEDDVDVLVGQVAVGGDYGSEYMKYSSSSKTNRDKEKLRSVTAEIENISANIIDKYTKCLKALENIFMAVLGEKTSVYYGPLTNLNKIMGRENRQFRETMSKTLQSIKFAIQVIDELRQIDDMGV